MANVKISELAVNSSPSDSATLAGVDGGETVQIPISKFVTKDEGGNVTVAGNMTVSEDITVDGGITTNSGDITSNGAVNIKSGNALYMHSDDNTEKVEMYCDDDGKLCLNGNTVATLDDIPDTSNFVTKDENGGVLIQTKQGNNTIEVYEDERESYISIGSNALGLHGVAYISTHDGSYGENGQALMLKGGLVTWGDIPSGGNIDASKFVTKDEDGNVIVTGNLEVKGSAIIEDGAVFNGDVEIGTGAYLYLDSEDGSNTISVYCGNDGKLYVDGKEVATVNDIPSGDSPMTSITYAELRALRDAGNLIPGMFYRITDYECTTAQENTRAMNHRFYIIVQALSHDTLSETAKADLVTDGTDDYFVDEGANVSAWEIKYCLDNDTTRFAWADEENGKGVIYYMKDEHGNECPYDFKNIQFKRMVSLENGYPTLDEENGEETWVYTFCGNSHHIANDEWSELKDGSLESPYGHQSDEGCSTFQNNIMKPYFMIYDNDNEDYTKCGKQYLNNNVFFGWWDEVGSYPPDEEYIYHYPYCGAFINLDYNCYNNTFGSYTKNIRVGANSSDNYIDGAFNEIGAECNYNTFRAGFLKIGNQCHSNSVYSTNTTLGDGCWGNVLDGNGLILLNGVYDIDTAGEYPMNKIYKGDYEIV